MKNIIFISVLMGLGVLLWQGCCKESNSTQTTDKITFRYNGKDETYGIVKRVYTKSAFDNSVLDTPIVRYWMDRNLGADRVPTSMTDSLGMGHLFQYGRGADGHQIANSEITLKRSETFIPGHNKFVADVMWHEYYLRPEKNWLYNSGPYNPCPSGWHVANSTDIKMEMNTWTEKTAVGAFNSELKIPRSLIRYGIMGDLSFLRLYSSLWLGDNRGFFMDSTRFTFSTYYSTGAGMCVRCVKGE